VSQKMTRFAKGDFPNSSTSYLAGYQGSISENLKLQCCM